MFICFYSNYYFSVYCHWGNIFTNSIAWNPWHCRNEPFYPKTISRAYISSMFDAFQNEINKEKVALMMIIIAGGELFTGNIMYFLVALVDRKVTFKDLLKNWIIVCILFALYV